MATKLPQRSLMFKACCLAALAAVTLLAPWHGLGLRVQLTGATTPWTRVLPAVARRSASVTPGEATSQIAAYADTKDPVAPSEPAATVGRSIAKSDKQGASPAQPERSAAAVDVAAGSAFVAAVLPRAMPNPASAPSAAASAAGANTRSQSAAAAFPAATENALASPPESTTVADGDAAVRATAVPPDQDRLFGRRLGRVPLDGSEQPFEPAAYRRCRVQLNDMLV